MLLIQYVFPLAVISFAYIRIWSKLRTHINPAGHSDSHHRRRKTTKMLVTMVRNALTLNFELKALLLHYYYTVQELQINK